MSRRRVLRRATSEKTLFLATPTISDMELGNSGGSSESENDRNEKSNGEPLLDNNLLQNLPPHIQKTIETEVANIIRQRLTQCKNEMISHITVVRRELDTAEKTISDQKSQIQRLEKEKLRLDKAHNKCSKRNQALRESREHFRTLYEELQRQIAEHYNTKPPQLEELPHHERHHSSSSIDETIGNLSTPKDDVSNVDNVSINQMKKATTELLEFAEHLGSPVTSNEMAFLSTPNKDDTKTLSADQPYSNGTLSSTNRTTAVDRARNKMSNFVADNLDDLLPPAGLHLSRSLSAQPHASTVAFRRHSVYTSNPSRHLLKNQVKKGGPLMRSMTMHAPTTESIQLNQTVARPPPPLPAADPQTGAPLSARIKPVASPSKLGRNHRRRLSLDYHLSEPAHHHSTAQGSGYHSCFDLRAISERDIECSAPHHITLYISGDAESTISESRLFDFVKKWKIRVSNQTYVWQIKEKLAQRFHTPAKCITLRNMGSSFRKLFGAQLRTTSKPKKISSKRSVGLSTYRLSPDGHVALNTVDNAPSAANTDNSVVQSTESGSVQFKPHELMDDYCTLEDAGIQDLDTIRAKIDTTKLRPVELEEIEEKLQKHDNKKLRAIPSAIASMTGGIGGSAASVGGGVGSETKIQSPKFQYAIDSSLNGSANMGSGARGNAANRGRRRFSDGSIAVHRPFSRNNISGSHGALSKDGLSFRRPLHYTREYTRETF